MNVLAFLLVIAVLALLLVFAALLISKPGRRRIALAVAAVALLATIPALAGGDLRTTRNDTVALHTKLVRVPEQPLASTTAFRAATSITGITIGSIITPTTSIAPGVVGRNVILTQVNFGGATTPVLTYRVECLNQFDVLVAESITISGGATGTGTKVCQTLQRLVIEASTGTEASDTVAIGTGNVVGLPFQFSADLREFNGIERVIAAGTTQTAVTINTTNLDTVNFACKATCFSASAVVNGDTLNILLRTDDRTQDNRFYPAP